MVAHSFRGRPEFGPAGKMHGATYTCDVEFGCSERQFDGGDGGDDDSNNRRCNWVIDIGYATDLLRRVLARYDYKNLDEVFPDPDCLTTTEFMCRQIYSDLRDELLSSSSAAAGSSSSSPLSRGGGGIIRVKLWESHRAWASYTGPV